LVDAGWIYTPTPEYDDMATCAYCDLALDGWEPSDKPLYAGCSYLLASMLTIIRDEHHKRSENCAFFTLITEHQETSNTPKMPAKSRKPRASKASRLSAQSAHTVASEEPSVADLPAEEDDSVLTTATNATTVSKSGRKMAKGKKPAKGRKTKTKKDQSVEVSVDMEPEDADFEVKVEQLKTTRGKKRTSDEIYETSTPIDVQPPPAKRRGTRNTRGSVAAVNDSSAPSYTEKDVDAIMTPADEIAPAPNRKKGRPSNARTQRNVSSASTASKASLRMAVPADDEIDRALQADLERPLTDDEGQEFTGGVPKSRRESRLKKSTVAASVAPVRKTTIGSKVHKDYEMFAAGEVSIDESVIDAELKAMEFEESMPLPKGKGTKGKQPRKPSAKQQLAAKRAAEAALTKTNAVEEKELSSNQVGNGDLLASFPKPRKGRNTGSMATSRKPPGRATRASVISMNEGNTTAVPDTEDAHDSAVDSDVSIASNSTVVRGGAKRRGSSMKKTKPGNKAVSRNIEEIIQRSADPTISQQEAEEAPQKKRGGKPKKVDVDEIVVMENPEQTTSTISQEASVQQPATKPSKSKASKSKGNGRVLPDLPAGPEAGTSKQGNRSAPKSPKRAPNELTPSLSPQSSDAENQPPSSKPSTIKQAGANSQASRVPLAASTPMASPSKRNIIAGLQSTQPWTAVDLDEILLQSPSDARAEKENAMSGLLAEAVGKVKKGGLTSPEKRMTVEEWIMYNASLAEERLKGECERMVGIFEREGGKAMRVLEGVVCTE
jgi:hypothetical protein